MLSAMRSPWACVGFCVPVALKKGSELVHGAMHLLCFQLSCKLAGPGSHMPSARPTRPRLGSLGVAPVRGAGPGPCTCLCLSETVLPLPAPLTSLLRPHLSHSPDCIFPASSLRLGEALDPQRSSPWPLGLSSAPTPTSQQGSPGCTPLVQCQPLIQQW